jgi:hypothetical protein
MWMPNFVSIDRVAQELNGGDTHVSCLACIFKAAKPVEHAGTSCVEKTFLLTSQPTDFVQGQNNKVMQYNSNNKQCKQPEGCSTVFCVLKNGNNGSLRSVNSGVPLHSATHPQA